MVQVVLYTSACRARALVFNYGICSSSTVPQGTMEFAVEHDHLPLLVPLESFASHRSVLVHVPKDKPQTCMKSWFI